MKSVQQIKINGSQKWLKLTFAEILKIEMHKFFFAYITMMFTFFHPALGDEKQRLMLKFGENTAIGFFAETGTSITSLKSHQKTITSKFELDFLDDNLLFSGESERFGISVSNEKFTHSVFHKKTDSNAELTIDLAGQPGSVVSSIRGFSLANLKTDELGYSFGWTFEPTEKFSSNFEVKISSLNSDYTLQNHYQAGLINSHETSRRKNQNFNFGYLQSVKWQPETRFDIFGNFERSLSTKGDYWSSEDFSISTGLRLNLQSPLEDKYQSKNLEGGYELKVFSSDGFGTGKGKFNNNADGFYGDTHYKNIIPLKSRSKRIRFLKKYHAKSIGIELFDETKVSKLSTVSVRNALGSNNTYDASTFAKLKLKGLSLILEKPFTNNAYFLFGANVSKLNYSIKEQYYLKNKTNMEGSNDDTPFINFKFGLGNKIKLRHGTHLFLETTAETVRGNWFGVDHSVEEFSTAIGLGASF